MKTQVQYQRLRKYVYNAFNDPWSMSVKDIIVQRVRERKCARDGHLIIDNGYDDCHGIDHEGPSTFCVRCGHDWLVQL